MLNKKLKYVFYAFTYLILKSNNFFYKLYILSIGER